MCPKTAGERCCKGRYSVHKGVHFTNLHRVRLHGALPPPIVVQVEKETTSMEMHLLVPLENSVPLEMHLLVPLEMHLLVPAVMMP